MHIVVLLKQILDPEIPPKEFRIDPQTNRPVQTGGRLVLDSYAENALEAAIQLRDKIPGSKVTALTLGDKPADEVLRRALGFTADAAVRIWDPAWADLDGLAVAHLLGKAIKALGGADLILAGRQAGDIEEGLVGSALSEELGVPCATLVAKIEVEGARVRVTRESEGGYSVVTLPLPAVLTITSSENNVPRLPKVKDTMMAMRKPIKVFGPADLGADPERLAPGVQLERAWVAAADVQCEILPGADGSTQAAHLVEKLQAMKVL